jgi:tRNA (guanine37-N1)-methyltransferase
MQFDIITLFPKMFEACPEHGRGDPFSESIISRAQKNGLVDIKIHNLRDFASDKHKTVDDTPYGGGAGMVLKVDVVDNAINSIKSRKWKVKKNKCRTILLTPTGKIFNQKKAIELSKYDNVILIAGHYEGFDQRIHQYLVDEELSIGEYVLTGGELPAMVVVDATTRMIPKVIKEESALNESFMDGYQASEAPEAKKLIYDYPVYTKPAEYKGWKVPDVLLSGNHAEIKKWRSTATDFLHRKDTE